MVVLLCIVQYAFNLFSLNAPVTENGYNEEEMKLVKERLRWWNDKEEKLRWFTRLTKKNQKQVVKKNSRVMSDLWR